MSLSDTYELEEYEVKSTIYHLRKKGDSDPERTLQTRLDGPEVDTLEHRRPERYDEGWHEACQELRQDSDETVAELRYDSDARFQDLRFQRKRAFLVSGSCTEELRGEYWRYMGHSDCLFEAHQLVIVDYEMTKEEVAEAMQQYDSIPAIREFAKQLQRDIEADRMQWVRDGGQL